MARVEFAPDDVPFVQLGKHILRLDLEELDEEMKERSRKELREVPEVVEESLAALKQLLEDEEGLNVPLDEVSYLTKFLRPCKFYPESAFKVMKRYYKFKLKHPKLSHNLMPKSVRHVFEEEVMTFIPTRGPGDTRILIVNAGSKWNPKKVSLSDMFRTVILALEIALIEPKTQVAGVHVIIDLEGLSLQHIWQFSPGFAKTILEFVQECNPIRLKGIHIVNQPYIFKMLYNIFKPFIGEKLRKRLFFHGYERKSLHDKISPMCLPNRFGGLNDIVECPGPVLADILCRYSAEFELCNKIGYVTPDKPQDEG